MSIARDPFTLNVIALNRLAGAEVRDSQTRKDPKRVKPLWTQVLTFRSTLFVPAAAAATAAAGDDSQNTQR